MLERYKVIKLKDIDKCVWNYKEDDIVLSEKLKQNISTNGQIENLIVGKIDGGDRYTCINGNHRIDAFRDMGSTAVVCCDLGEVSLAQAQRIAIETNETVFPVDTLKLSQVIQGLTGTFSIEELERSLPYTIEELNFFIDEAEALVALPQDDLATDDMGALDNDARATGNRCPQCGFELE